MLIIGGDLSAGSPTDTLFIVLETKRFKDYDLAPLTNLWFDSAKKRSLTKN